MEYKGGAPAPQIQNPRPYQPPQPPVPGYPMPQPPTKQRRVGTFTLGLTLILVGILIPLCFFLDRSFIRFFQFAPLVLAFLGVEVLYYAIRFKEGKLKYDGVSIFLVILLTIFSLFAATVVPFFANMASLETYLDTQQRDVRKIVNNVIAENGSSEANIHVSGYGNNREFSMIYNFNENNPPELAVYVSCKADSDELTQEQAVEMTEKISRAIASSGKPVEELTVTIYSADSYMDYHANFNGADLGNLSRNLIEKKMWTEN